MAFLEQRMDPRIERGARGGPTNRGRVKTYGQDGSLRQVFGWSSPLHEWDVSHGLKTQQEEQALLALWYVVNFTPYEGFRFRDPADHIATSANTSLLQLTATTYQLRRSYTFGGITFHRKISKPAAGVQVFNAGGTLLTSTVDTTTGVATVASGTPAYWTGVFDIPVTFKNDAWVRELEASQTSANIIMPSIEIEEIRIA
jgi:uncharacterized protein (TIGR02217 family)